MKLQSNVCWTLITRWQQHASQMVLGMCFKCASTGTSATLIPTVCGNVQCLMSKMWPFPEMFSSIQKDRVWSKNQIWLPHKVYAWSSKHKNTNGAHQSMKSLLCAVTMKSIYKRIAWKTHIVPLLCMRSVWGA